MWDRYTDNLQPFDFLGPNQLFSFLFGEGAGLRHTPSVQHWGLNWVETSYPLPVLFLAPGLILIHAARDILQPVPRPKQNQGKSQGMHMGASNRVEDS